MIDIRNDVNKCAIYARVSPTKHVKSSNDLHVSLEESLRICRSEAERERIDVYDEYIDEYVSGKSSSAMTQFQRMLADAREGKFTRIITRRVNRFGRNRSDMILAQIELEKLGISIRFIENGIDTGLPFGKSIFALMSELAEMERAEILENTQRGRENAQSNGVKFGQPKKDFNTKLIRKLRMLPAGDPDRPTWSQLEDMLGVGRSTMIRRLKELGYWDPIEKKVI